jgi:hypothetical protein
MLHIPQPLRHPLRHHPLWHALDTLAIAGMLAATGYILWATRAPLWSLALVGLLILNDLRMGATALVAWGEEQGAGSFAPAAEGEKGAKTGAPDA